MCKQKTRENYVRNQTHDVDNMLYSIGTRSKVVYLCDIHLNGVKTQFQIDTGVVSLTILYQKQIAIIPDVQQERRYIKPNTNIGECIEPGGNINLNVNRNYLY